MSSNYEVLDASLEFLQYNGYHFKTNYTVYRHDIGANNVLFELFYNKYHDLTPHCKSHDILGKCD